MRLDAMTDSTTYNAALAFLDGECGESPLAGSAVESPPLDAEEQHAADFAKVVKGALPDDLQVLALEFDLHCDRRLVKFQLAKQDKSLWWKSVSVTNQLLGPCWKAESGNITVFGKSDQFRLRLDMIVSREILERRLRLRGGEYGIRLPLQWENKDGERLTLALAGAKLLPSFAHTSEDGESEWEWYCPHADVDVGDFYTGDRLEPEGYAKWARAAQTTDKHLDRFFSLADACDGDILAIGDTLDRVSDKPTHVSFLVPGLIPRGVVTLLLGDKKTGKSAIAMELAVAIARKESHWLGFPLAPCKGHAVYLLGEDAPGEAARRVQRMAGGETPDLLYVIPADGTELDGLLETLKKHKVDCLIVDPARKYHTGNEDDSTEISNMLNKLQTFAAAKDCAVVVLHHLKRGAVIRNIDDLGTNFRGSGVYTDRARVTLGLLRRASSNETASHVVSASDDPPWRWRSDIWESARTVEGS
jgi:hypothetical protein